MKMWRTVKSEPKQWRTNDLGDPANRCCQSTACGCCGLRATTGTDRSYDAVLVLLLVATAATTSDTRNLEAEAGTAAAIHMYCTWGKN